MSAPQLPRDFIRVLGSSGHKWVSNDFSMGGSNILGEKAELELLSSQYAFYPNMVAGLREGRMYRKSPL